MVLLFCAFIPLAGASAERNRTVVLSAELRQTLEALPHLYGRKIKEAGLEGRVVLVSFFASWCPPCNIEFRHLNEIHDTYRSSGLSIVAINHFEGAAGFNDGGARLDRFLTRHAPWYSVVKGNDAIARTFANVTRIPTVLIFDRRGRLAHHFIHRQDSRKSNLTMDEIHKALAPLLGQSLNPKNVRTGQ